MALATIEDLENRLERTFDEGSPARARAAALLDDASAAVIAETGQTFATGERTVRLRARGRKVRLPRPASDVSEVLSVGDGGDALDFTWYAGTVIDLASIPLEGWVDVTFTVDEVPAIVVAVVCQMVGRALGVKPDESGVQSESVGDYSYTVGAAAAAGAVGMLPDERRALRGLGPVGSTIALDG